VFAAVAIESLGIPIPGETMLVTAAVYAGATHRLSIAGVIGASIAGAIIGDNIGYSVGRRTGFRLLLRHGRRIHVDEGRFISILRTYAAFLAGVSHMEWRRFFVYNAAGGIVWSTTFGLAGYYGQQAFKQLSTPLDIALGVAGLAAIVGGVFFIRRRAEQLAIQAEQAYPGPLGDDRTG
jgi:membrane protein DedA with SNARE-associated domain